MTGDHYDEELLLALLDAGRDVIARDEHLRTCTDCRTTLDSLSSITTALQSKDVWEGPEFNPEPNANVLATLRAAQTRMTSEDALAEEYVKQLLAGPRETWSPRLAAHPEWRTPGTVRKLIAATDRAIETMPPDALEIANLAVEIAEGLGAPPLLTARALYERGYALMYTGAYIDALAALDKAEEIASATPSGDYQRGRILIVKAYTSRALNRLEAAAAAASSAYRIFTWLEDHDRKSMARFTLSLIYQSAGRFREALSIHNELISDRRSSRQSRASALQNAAVCYRELRQFDAAAKAATEAISLYFEVGMYSYALRARWTLARILTAQNRDDDAIKVLRVLKTEFGAAGMANEFALVSLDIAEGLLRMNRASEVAALCREAMDYFTGARIADSHFAMSALALLHEAAALDRLDRESISRARTILNVHSHPSSPQVTALLYSD